MRSACQHRRVPVDVVSPVLVGREQELARLRAALDRTAAGERVRRAGRRRGRRRQEPAARGGVRRLGRATSACSPAAASSWAARACRSSRWSRPCARSCGRRPAPSWTASSGRPAASSPGCCRSWPRRTTLPRRRRRQHRAAVRARAGRARPARRRTDRWSSSSRTCTGPTAPRSTWSPSSCARCRAPRVLLVLTYRSDEVDRRSPLRPLLSGWERLRGVERVQLRALQPRRGGRPGGRHPRARRPTADLVDLIFDRSEGNAFFVEELVRTVRDGAARDRAAAVAARRPARAGRAAVPARPSGCCARPPSPAAGCPSGCSPRSRPCPAAELYEALREAVDASLLLVDGTGRGYAFRHALTRDAVYDDLLPGERVELHTAYAEALDRDPGLAGDDASVAATLAVHWYAAHDLPRALAASVQAGRRAMAAFAPAEARQHLERALEVWRSVPDAETRAGADQVEVLQLTARATFYVRRPGAGADPAAAGAGADRPRPRPRAGRLRRRAAGRHPASPRRRLPAASRSSSERSPGCPRTPPERRTERGAGGTGQHADAQGLRPGRRGRPHRAGGGPGGRLQGPGGRAR